MNRRLEKVNEAIRESVSTTVLFGLKDPRVKNVTVIRAEATGDLQHAKVYVSVRGDDATRTLCLHGLESSRGYIQHKLADRLQTRYTPQLTFILDRGVEMAAATSAILNEVLPAERLLAEKLPDELEEGVEQDAIPERDALDDSETESTGSPA